ncbi:hypothetical protein HOLleu_14350 [Holothuria leucospilota]|uniref:SCAN box domain-containing protein n=1 Tax=Holothuria leucospilota TaxID=206669 RepID=A0A9Q1C7F3_HOLLE|nr:hypothetical protein HOLleu_14350 [Holothuria leucospilota]
MERYQNYVKIGQELGLTGKDLLDFANEKDQKDRESENAAREERRKDVKIAEKKASEQTDASGSQSTRSVQKPRLPKLQSFSEVTDDLDAYIQRFERFAKAAGWPDSEWAISLGALLTGRALETYSRLPLSDVNDYKKVKAALLIRYNLTEEGFREKFRNAQLHSKESYTQLGERLRGYVNRWVESAGKNKTYDDLLDIIVREQVLSVCSKDICLYLLKRGSLRR